MSTLVLVAIFAGALVLYFAYRPKPAGNSTGVVHPHVLPTTGSGMRSPGRASGGLLAAGAARTPSLAPPTTRAARTPDPVPDAASKPVQPVADVAYVVAAPPSTTTPLLPATMHTGTTEFRVMLW